MTSNVERLLQGALVPVDPPGALGDRLERRLTEITHAAAHEFTEFDPRALRDPRRWARLAAAGVVGAGAGGALVVIRARQRSRRREARGLSAVGAGMRGAAAGARRRLGR